MPHRFNPLTPENWLRPASRWEHLPHLLPPPPPGAAAFVLAPATAVLLAAWHCRRWWQAWGMLTISTGS